jgi:hypothetical protein
MCCFQSQHSNNNNSTEPDGLSDLSKRRTGLPALPTITYPEMEFLDINVTEDSNLSLHADHSLSSGRFLKKTKLYSTFQTFIENHDRIVHRPSLLYTDIHHVCSSPDLSQIMYPLPPCISRPVHGYPCVLRPNLSKIEYTLQYLAGTLPAVGRLSTCTRISIMRAPV